MKEMTDRELTDRISQVFENFEDPGAAHGWQELRKKYPENNTRVLWLWWGAAAAVLVLVCGLWFINPLQIEPASEMAGADASMKNEKVKGGEPREIIPGTEAEPSGSSSERNLAEISKSASAAQYGRNNEIAANAPVEEMQPKEILPHVSVGDRAVLISSPNVQNVIVNKSIGLSTVPVSEQLYNLSAANTAPPNRDSLIEATGKMLALAQEIPATGDESRQIKDISYSSRKTTDAKSSFSFYAGSYFNYSLGSETKLNFGGGFTSDIRLASNLKLSTGLGLANNSLTYNDGVPSSNKEKLAYDALPSFGTGVSGNNNLTTITKYDASLLALDIPINLKYQIIPKDNKLYVLAGLSSGTYLAENYSVDYRNYSVAGSFVSQTQGLEVKKQLQTFDFARTLNISFGYSANLGKTQNITLEPFLKYPLSGLGSEDLKFGATGINVKLNFSRFKK